MKTIAQTILALAAATALFTGSLSAAVETGKPAPDFTLTDITGQSHKLSDFKGKTVVLEWVNPECPFVVKHYGSGNLPNLQKTATADGVVWLAINSGRENADGSYDAAKASSWLKTQHAVPTAYFRDLDGQVGRLYGAKTTPQIFVISKEGTLVYDGAIDSIRSANVADIAKATNYVTTTLTALKAGHAIEKPNTQPYGCSVKY